MCYAVLSRLSGEGAPLAELGRMGSPSVTHTQAAAHLLLTETLLLTQTLRYREREGCA